MTLQFNQNAVSFVAVLAALLAMRPAAQVFGTAGNRLSLLFGGVSPVQVARVYAVTIATVLVALYMRMLGWMTK